MSALMQWFHGTVTGEIFWTMLVSMVPVIELRGGLPVGVALGLRPWTALCAAIVGNLIPVPFIIVFTRRILAWLRQRSQWLERRVNWLERRAHLKGQTVNRYGFIGLCILVAIPLPGTGAWTGALVAAFLDMRLKRAVPAIVIGVIIAGLVVSVITYGVAAIL